MTEDAESAAFTNKPVYPGYGLYRITVTAYQL
jgi:hypothetical protein